MSFIRQAIQTAKSSPQRLFWIFALMHLVVWTIVPSLTSENLPMDVVEGYAWGHEWLIGTHKHPPMQAWILEILFFITGHAKWAPYLTSQLAIITAFWAVWQTGRRIGGEKVGLIGALLLEGVVYYNFTSPELNPNVLQIPFWALAGWSFHKAVTDNKIRDWMLFGIWAAAGMYTKYSTGLFLIVLVAAMLSHRDGRRRLTGIGPYLSVTVACLLFLPHFMWLVHNDFIPWDYTEGRLERNADHYSALLTTTMMVLGQLVAVLFTVFLVILIYDRRRAPRDKPAASFDRVFLSFAAFGPFVAMFGMSLIFGYHIRDMWETPFWNFIGLWAVVFMRPALMPHDLRRFAAGWVVVFIAGVLVFASNEVLSPYVTTKPKRTIFPGKHMAHIMDDAWLSRYHKPLKYAIGDTWLAGNVAWYTDDRPHVYMDGDARISPWIDQGDLKKSGGIIMWCMKCGERSFPNAVPDSIQMQFPQAEVQEPLSLKRMTDANVAPALIGWAIVPPQPAP